jgi:hypothetical protein
MRDERGTEAGPDAERRPSDLRASGGCLCGFVTFEVRGPLRDVVYCHCRQCRRSHGTYAAYSAARREHLNFTEIKGLKWFESSPKARRGFCDNCGASLFWDSSGNDYVALAAGSLDQPTGLKSIRHIFAADKGDYYEIADGLEILPQGHAGPRGPDS